MEFAIGSSTEKDPKVAAFSAVKTALGQLKSGVPRALLVYGTAGYDQAELLSAVREASPEGEIVGCSTSGLIIPEGALEQRYAVGVMAMASEGLFVRAYHEPKLGEEPQDCASKLAEAVKRDLRGERGLLLVFPDGLTGNVSGLLDELSGRLPSGLTIAGGTSGELLRNDRTWQYFGGEVFNDTVSALLIQGEFETELSVSHGCDVIGKEQTITRAEKGWVYEIDGQPAWQVYKEFLNVGEDEPLTMSHYCYICLAKQLPEEKQAFGSHVIRCPLGVDREKGALFFPGDLPTGAKVRMALRNSEHTLKRAADSAEEILKRRKGQKPMLVFQFDCCCRGKLMFGERERACVRPLQEMFGLDVPWYGFQTYGEIARLGNGSALFHNYTAVLCALYPASRGKEENR